MAVESSPPDEAFSCSPHFFLIEVGFFTNGSEFAVFPNVPCILYLMPFLFDPFFFAAFLLYSPNSECPPFCLRGRDTALRVFPWILITLARLARRSHPAGSPL